MTEVHLFLLNVTGTSTCLSRFDLLQNAEDGADSGEQKKMFKTTGNCGSAKASIAARKRNKNKPWYDDESPKLGEGV